MEREVKRNFGKADCLFMASAVSDWRPRKAVRGKIKKGPAAVSLRLVKNPDILSGVAKKKGGKIVAGFALESKGVVENAKDKLRRKNLDIVVANRVGGRTPFGSGRTDVTILDRNGGSETIKNAAKEKIARRLISAAERLWEEKG